MNNNAEPVELRARILRQIIGRERGRPGTPLVHEIERDLGQGAVVIVAFGERTDFPHSRIQGIESRSGIQLVSRRSRLPFRRKSIERPAHPAPCLLADIDIVDQVPVGSFPRAGCEIRRQFPRRLVRRDGNRDGQTVPKGGLKIRGVRGREDAGRCGFDHQYKIRLDGLRYAFELFVVRRADNWRNRQLPDLALRY